MKITRHIIGFASLLAFAAPPILVAQKTSPTPLGTPVPAPASSASLTTETTPSPSPSSSPLAGFEERMQQLDEQLNSIFAGTFRDFGNWFGDPSLASSVDLREQKDKYVVRVYVPGNDTSKVNARVENGMLHVTTWSTFIGLMKT
jgi:hypothetical protein